MAYAPYQPWDKTYSYAEGETCIYNGLPYVFWLYGSTIPKSNAGVPPNEEMRLFDAVSPLDGSKESRMERSWVVGEVFIAGELNDMSARYGNIRTLQPIIRGNNASTDPILSPYNGALYNGVMYGGNRFFPDPLQDPLPPEQQPEVSWDFYRTGFAMSVDYKQDGNNGNIAIGSIEDGTTGKTSMPKGLSSGSSPYLVSVNVPPVGPPPDPPVNTFDVFFKIPDGNSISIFNCFNRIANFSIVNGSGDIVGSGSVSSGPVRENWTNNNTYTKVRFSFPSGDFVALVLDSITPRFDQ
jgi:hypothetical protein